MKKNLYFLILALLPILTFAQSSGNPDSGYFASIVAGPTSSNGYSTTGVSLPSKSDTYVISGGYFFNKYFLASAGYRGASSQNYLYASGASASSSSNAFSVVFNGLGIYPVSENVSLTGGLTLMYLNYSGASSVTNNGSTTSWTSSKVGTLPLYNVGGMLQLDKSLYLTGNYVQSVKYDVPTSNNYGITTKGILVGVLKKF